MTRRFQSLRRFAVALAIVSMGFPGLLLAHGKALEKKGGGPAVQEVGPHGGGVIDIGDGHFELVRASNGELSLYRLDEELKVIPAEDVDGAVIHMIGADGEVVTASMSKVGGSEAVPLHYSAGPILKGHGGFTAVIAVSMGEESQNLRFLVQGV